MQGKAVIVIFLLALLGVAGFYFLQPDEKPEIERDPTTNVSEEADKGKATPEVGTREDPVRTSTESDTNREEIKNVIDSGAKSPQGVKGRLVSPSGAPVAGATLFLIRGVGLDSFKMLLRWQKGERFPPVAMASSAPDGTFRIGLKNWTDKTTYEVRVLHDDFADHRLERIQVQPQDWWDVGDVPLKTGVTVFGSVFNENGGGIANAKITAKPQFTHGMLSVPGREDGKTVEADASGNYELRNVDPNDVSGLSAYARGHSRTEKTELNLHGQTRVQIDFQLSVGFEIAGIVTDATGKPVRGATVTCAALSQKDAQEQKAYTDDDGVFVAENLRSGLFTVIVEAEGFQRAEEKPIEAGSLDLKITVERLGSVYVTAIGKNGVPLRSFTCNMKPALDGQSTYGKPLVRKEIRAAKDGAGLVSGLQPMTYVAEVIADGYAKNFSPKFTITAGSTEPLAVEVKLNQGGTMRGMVQDANGKPIAGAAVKTMPHDLIENPLIAAFGGAPYTITRSTKTTDKNGRYEFKFLHPGKYQLKFTHPEYCAVFTNDNVAEVDGELDLDPVTMPRGCLVSGIASVEGKATGQIKVHVSAVAEEGKMSSFTTDATTDNKGRFLLLKRVPPGKYEVRAAQMNLGPFHIMIQMQKSKKEFSVDGVKEHMELMVDVPVLKNEP